MKSSSLRRVLGPLFLTAWVAGTGCSAFRPVTVMERHFVLSATAPEQAAATEAPTTQGVTVAVAVGAVRVPAYLATTRLAVRRGPHEIGYSDSMLWAERIEKGAQRVVAVNLAALLPHATLSTSMGSREVRAEVHIRLTQFEVDLAGQGVIAAAWRITDSGGEELLHAAYSRIALSGPPPGSDPDGAVATLSALLGRLSEEVARALAQSPAS